MEYVYGTFCEEIKNLNYTGVTTDTAVTTVDNVNRTIAVDVLGLDNFATKEELNNKVEFHWFDYNWDELPESALQSMKIGDTFGASVNGGGTGLFTVLNDGYDVGDVYGYTLDNRGVQFLHYHYESYEQEPPLYKIKLLAQYSIDDLNLQDPNFIRMLEYVCPGDVIYVSGDMETWTVAVANEFEGHRNERVELRQHGSDYIAYKIYEYNKTNKVWRLTTDENRRVASSLYRHEFEVQDANLNSYRLQVISTDGFEYDGEFYELILRHPERIISIKLLDSTHQDIAYCYMNILGMYGYAGDVYMNYLLFDDVSPMQLVFSDQNNITDIIFEPIN